jgi:hypothetical protein
MSHDFDRSRLLKEGVVLPDACKAFSRVLPLLMTQTKATQPVAALAVGHAERAIAEAQSQGPALAAP